MNMIGENAGNIEMGLAREREFKESLNYFMYTIAENSDRVNFFKMRASRYKKNITQNAGMVIS